MASCLVLTSRAEAPIVTRIQRQRIPTLDTRGRRHLSRYIPVITEHRHTMRTSSALDSLSLARYLRLSCKARSDSRTFMHVTKQTADQTRPLIPIMRTTDDLESSPFQERSHTATKWTTPISVSPSNACVPLMFV